MYFFKNLKNTIEDIEIGDTVRLIISDTLVPINFSIFRDYNVLDIINNSVVINLNRYLKSGCFYDDNLNSVKIFGDFIDNKIDTLNIIPFEYIWLVNKNKSNKNLI